MRVNRALIAASYGIALLMIAIPLSEAVLSVWPLRIGSASWRFGAMGLISRALLTPMIGLAFASAIALALRQFRIVRAIALFAGCLAFGLLLANGLFALDAFEVQSRVRPEAASAFRVAALQAELKLASATVVCGLLAVGAWRAAVPLAHSRTVRAKEYRAVHVPA